MRVRDNILIYVSIQCVRWRKKESQRLVMNTTCNVDALSLHHIAYFMYTYSLETKLVLYFIDFSLQSHTKQRLSYQIETT